MNSSAAIPVTDALALIKAVLESPTVKLVGSHITKSDEHAKADAQYILTLYRTLTGK